jgi:hypothetical protein
MKNSPIVKSGTNGEKSAADKGPWLYSASNVATYPIFSTMPGIISGRNRCGSDPITRNPICQAIVTARKP